MVEVDVVDSRSGTRLEGRALGCVRGQRPGGTLLCVAGIHGNEPAGVHAVQRVFGAVQDRAAEMTGDFVALAGNLSALAVGRRFVDRDLNRAWTDSRLRALRENGRLEGPVEDREQRELLAEIERVLSETRGRVYALDLHTTSGPGGIFSAFADALPHRAFASHFPVPMIFGLDEQVDGTLVSLLSDHGLIAITVETGQHQEPAAINRAAAAIWVAVVTSGILPERLVPEAADARKLLQRDSSHLPRALEMRYCRGIVDGDGFEMEPGYSNFQEVVAGQVIARDAQGVVLVGEDARLLMPLYQEQGEDGYLLVREFRPFWMHVSHVLRRVRLGRIAHWLPGVQRVEGTDDEVVVDKRVAQFFAKQLFHLLGFRQLGDAGPRLVMRRRPFDEDKYLSRKPPLDSLWASSAGSTTPPESGR